MNIEVDGSQWPTMVWAYAKNSDGDVHGRLQLLADGEGVLYLKWVDVDEESRGQGVASSLLDGALQEFTSRAPVQAVRAHSATGEMDGVMASAARRHPDILFLPLGDE